MKICHFVTSTLNTHYFANLCGGLSERGISLLGVTLHDPLPPDWLSTGKGRYTCLNAKGKLQLPLAVWRLAKILRCEKIELLQTHLFDAGLVGILAARLARIPVVVITRHHTDEMWIVGTRWHIQLDRLMARFADYVIGFSQAVKQHLVSREDVSSDKIEVIYQGFDFNILSASKQECQQIRREFQLESKFAIGCIARFFKTKGHTYLIEALKQVSKEIPNVRLVLFGGGRDQSLLEDQIRKLGLDEYVIFAGHRKDVAACITAMDLIVHPSLTEAFCQAVIETMAAGTALIATDVAAASEVVFHGENGILVPPRDPQAIVDAVLQLYLNPELRKQIAKEGQRSVRERFTIDKMVNRQIDCYRQWLGESQATEEISSL